MLHKFLSYCLLYQCCLQVCYDLGAIYFQQGATNAALHENAKEKFFKTKELIAKVMSVILLCVQLF